MAEFKKLTYEGLQVGEEFVSDTFLVTPEEIETYAFAVDDHHPWFFDDSPFGRVVVDVRCVNQDGETTAVGTASGLIR